MKQLIIPMCFILLTSYAYGHAKVLNGHGNRTDSEAFFSRLLDEAKPVKLWKQPSALAKQQAEVLAMVYGVTDQNVDSWKEW